MHFKTPELNKAQQANLLSLEEALYHHRDLGKNVVLNWCPREKAFNSLETRWADVVSR
jgi:hypothetical protein